MKESLSSVFSGCVCGEEESCLHFLLEPSLVPSPVLHFESRAPLKLCAEGLDFVNRNKAHLRLDQPRSCLQGTVAVFINLLMYISIYI